MNTQEIRSIISDFNTDMSCLKEHIHNLSHKDEYTSSSDIAIMVQQSLTTINLCDSHITRMMRYDTDLAKTMEQQLRQAESIRASYL